MAKFTVIFDACILYPAVVRDSAMRLAMTGLFKAHWTDQIHDEWINGLKREKDEEGNQRIPDHILLRITRVDGFTRLRRQNRKL